MSILAASTVSSWPIVVLAVSIVFVIAAISVLRLHAFLALILAALLAGVMSPTLEPDPKAPDKGHLVRAVELTSEGFGKTAGGIAIVIGMATIIGMCLMESGAADKVVRRFLAVFGEKRAGIALLLSTYFLSIPIFFDSMYMLMVPIAMAMALRTGRDFTLYCMAICSGGVVTHSLTVPHPGPVFMVDALKIDTGLSIWIGIAVGLVPALGSWFLIKRLNAATPIPLRETPNAPIDSVRKIQLQEETSLPSFLSSILPIILPILLITAATIIELFRMGQDASGRHQMIPAKQVIDFVGNKNVALIIGAALSLLLLKRHKKLSLRQIMDLAGPPLETAGVIILITAAGGAFGYMLLKSGVDKCVEDWAKTSQLSLLLIAWLVAVLIRIAQGSATVAMQTTVAIMAGLLPQLDCHAVYLFLAIGFGAICCSWMNDSGFWVVSRLSGFTARETLRTWTVLLTFLSVSGFLLTFLLAKLLPFKPANTAPPAPKTLSAIVRPG